MIIALYLLGQHWLELVAPLCTGMLFFGLLYWTVWLHIRITRRHR